jgi:methylmalonyl-CoA epimerase
MIKNFDHVGIVVRNTEEMLSLFSKLFGFQVSESLNLPEQGFKSTLISKEGVTLELIEPIGPEGIIQKFLEKRGEGIHHISIQTDDIGLEMKSLKANGAQLLSEEPHVPKGTSNKGAFINPRSTHGILIELIQRSKT